MIHVWLELEKFCFHRENQDLQFIYIICSYIFSFRICVCICALVFLKVSSWIKRKEWFRFKTIRNKILFRKILQFLSVLVRNLNSRIFSAHNWKLISLKLYMSRPTLGLNRCCKTIDKKQNSKRITNIASHASCDTHSTWKSMFVCCKDLFNT